MLNNSLYDPWEDDDGTPSTHFTHQDVLGHFYNGSLSRTNLKSMLRYMSSVDKDDVITDLIIELEYTNKQFGNSNFTHNERKELEDRIIKLREDVKDKEFLIETLNDQNTKLESSIHKMLRKIKLMFKAIARLNMNKKFDEEIKAQLQQERNYIDFEKIFEKSSDELDSYEDKLNFD